MKRKQAHLAIVEERRDNDTYSSSMPMPGRVWFVCTCTVTGRVGYGRVEKDGERYATDEDMIAVALRWLGSDCRAEHVL